MAVHVGGRGPGHLARVQGFSIDLFLAQQEAGFWADFTRTDTSFQESVGPTPANAAGNPIGLTLDQRLWNGQSRVGYVAGQSNLTSAGSWLPATTSGGATATESPAGTLNLATDGSGIAFADQQITTVAGRIYEVKATVAGNVATTVAGAAQGSATFLNTGMIGGGLTTALYFVASGATSWVRFLRGAAGSCTISAISVREVSQTSITQATAGSRPLWQANGAEFNGTAHNLLTNFAAGSGANTLIARVTVPASLAAVQWVAGARTSGGNERFAFGFNTSGNVVGGLGFDSTNIIKSNTDRRGQTVTIGLSCNGQEVRLFDLSELAFTGAQSGSPTTVVPLRIGAWNDGGTAGSLFAGSIQHAIAYRGGPILDEARFQQIANALGG